MCAGAGALSGRREDGGGRGGVKERAGVGDDGTEKEEVARMRRPTLGVHSLGGSRTYDAAICERERLGMGWCFHSERTRRAQARKFLEVLTRPRI